MNEIDIGLYIAYFLFFLASGAAIFFPLFSLVKHPKSLGKSGLGVGALIVLFGISYALSGSELNPKWAGLGVTTEFNSKMIGAGLTMFYFILIIAIIVMIYSAISKAFK